MIIGGAASPFDGAARPRHRLRVKRLALLTVLLVPLACRSRGAAPGASAPAADPTARARAAVHEIAAAMNQFRADNAGRCPKDQAELVAAKKLARPMKDPWDNEFVITCPGNYDLKGGADVTSPGPDHELGNHDDVNSWE
jgi:hypothetical protein